MQIVCAAPLAALARDQEEQNNVEWLPKRFAHAHSVSGATQHCFAPLDPSRGRQEELHTQFARRMETKVVVAKSDSAVYYLRQQHKFGLSNAARGQQMSALVKANRFS